MQKKPVIALNQDGTVPKKPYFFGKVSYAVATGVLTGVLTGVIVKLVLHVIGIKD